MSKIKLEYIIEHLQNCIAGVYVYVDKKTGDLEAIMSEAMKAAMEGKVLEEEWILDQVEMAKLILADKNHERFIRLPDETTINENDAIITFIDGIEDESVRFKFYDELKDSPSPGRFRNLLQSENMFDEFHDFEDSYYEEMAKSWCNDNNVEFYI